MEDLTSKVTLLEDVCISLTLLLQRVLQLSLLPPHKLEPTLPTIQGTMDDGKPPGKY